MGIALHYRILDSIKMQWMFKDFAEYHFYRCVTIFSELDLIVNEYALENGFTQNINESQHNTARIENEYFTNQ